MSAEIEIPYQVEVHPMTGVTSGKLGIWIFLASELMLFGALFSSYVLLRVGSGVEFWPTGVTSGQEAVIGKERGQRQRSQSHARPLQHLATRQRCRKKTSAVRFALQCHGLLNISACQFYPVRAIRSGTLQS